MIDLGYNLGQLGQAAFAKSFLLGEDIGNLALRSAGVPGVLNG